MSGGIYQIRNRENGKIYIGSAVNIEKRWEQHRHCLRYGKHHNPHLQSAWNKYGENSFDFDILEHVPDKNDLVTIEQYYMDWLESWSQGYNIRSDADSNLGVKHSKSARAKISDALKGHCLSEETRVRISNTLMGRRMDDETRAKISKAHKGKSKSDETRARMSAAQRGKCLSDTTRQRISETKKARSKQKAS